MLIEWRNQQNYETNQVEIMRRALKEQGLTELATKVFGSQQLLDVQPFCVKTRREYFSGTLQQNHEGYMTDFDLQFFAKILGKDWKKFGIDIGLKLDEINRIEMDFSPPIVDASLEMLIRWRDRQYFTVNQVNIFSATLKKLEMEDINEEFHTYLKYISFQMSDDQSTIVDAAEACATERTPLKHREFKDIIPEEILTRGQEALEIYKEELSSGKIRVNHARVMTAGKHGVGKTSLVNTLLGKPFNEEEPSTDGIVLTTAFKTSDCGWETEVME
ncbi:uncharacterized protein LOC117123208, partial [Anneissia japonica]|uniref:uncharacterized protein LOC117123208 n=1 Tax=Anneissia japonica TaxID=1529436 RepID=UPI001425AD74